METKKNIEVQEVKVKTKKEDLGKTIAKVDGKYEILNSDKGLVIFVKKDLRVRVRLMKSSVKA